jgi:hypothetical protein
MASQNCTERCTGPGPAGILYLRFVKDSEFESVQERPAWLMCAFAVSVSFNVSYIAS